MRKHVSPTNINNARHSANNIQHLTGIDPSLLSARNLRPGGATALLCTGIDTDVIQLLGHWKSDAMLRYLRVAALAHTSNLSQQMLTAGTYTFAPMILLTLKGTKGSPSLSGYIAA
jgi:site-specific recombinase XerD